MINFEGKNQNKQPKSKFASQQIEFVDYGKCKLISALRVETVDEEKCCYLGFE